MTKLHRVLAAVDFSEPARAAFDHALALSRLHDAELTVVHAVPTDRPFRWHARERIALIGSLRDAAQTAGVRFKVSVQHGDPAGVILLHASARRADLIVLGTQRAIGLRSLPFWFGRRDRCSRGDPAGVGRPAGFGQDRRLDDALQEHSGCGRLRCGLE